MGVGVGALVSGGIGGYANFERYRISKGFRKRQHRLRTLQLHHTRTRIGRAEESFREESEREKQRLVQSLAARGLSRSTIAEQDLSRLERARVRALEDFREKREIVDQQISLLREQRRLERKYAYIGAVSSILGAGAQGAGALGGGGGGDLGALS